MSPYRKPATGGAPRFLTIERSGTEKRPRGTLGRIELAPADCLEKARLTILKDPRIVRIDVSGQMGSNDYGRASWTWKR